MNLHCEKTFSSQHFQNQIRVTVLLTLKLTNLAQVSTKFQYKVMSLHWVKGTQRLIKNPSKYPVTSTSNNF